MVRFSRFFSVLPLAFPALSDAADRARSLASFDMTALSHEAF
jgi:hypothetical protein